MCDNVQSAFTAKLYGCFLGKPVRKFVDSFGLYGEQDMWTEGKIISMRSILVASSSHQGSNALPVWKVMWNDGWQSEMGCTELISIMTLHPENTTDKEFVELLVCPEVQAVLAQERAMLERDGCSALPGAAQSFEPNVMAEQCIESDATDFDFLRQPLSGFYGAPDSMGTDSQPTADWVIPPDIMGTDSQPTADWVIPPDNMNMEEQLGGNCLTPPCTMEGVSPDVTSDTEAMVSSVPVFRKRTKKRELGRVKKQDAATLLQWRQDNPSGTVDELGVFLQQTTVKHSPERCWIWLSHKCKVYQSKQEKTRFYEENRKRNMTLQAMKARNKKRSDHVRLKKRAQKLLECVTSTQESSAKWEDI